jgi:hypothetical protein
MEEFKERADVDGVDFSLPMKDSPLEEEKFAGEEDYA